MKRSSKDQDDNLFLIDLLFDSNLTLTEIGKELNYSYSELNKRINHLGLSWIKSQKKKSSRGQAALTQAMRKLLPGQSIVNEYHIGEYLKLDVYCPSYKIAAEFHGRQHFYYTKRFFDTEYDFREAQKRDQRKIELCTENGIALIVFRYNDSLTEQSVYDRLLDALRQNPLVPKEKKINKSITQNQFYQASKERYNQSKKDMYKKAKRGRGTHE